LTRGEGAFNYVSGVAGSVRVAGSVGSTVKGLMMRRAFTVVRKTVVRRGCKVHSLLYVIRKIAKVLRIISFILILCVAMCAGKYCWYRAMDGLSVFL
jgi:hypothetical protein